MDVLAHSLWSIAVLPGDQIAGKVIFGILPDIMVFAPNLIVYLLRNKKFTRFESREQMMEWFDRKDNRWVKTLYRWTHSLVVWSVIVLTGFLFCNNSSNAPPWFILAAPLHILMDIPTHTKSSFPVKFLTPFSSFQIDGFHWSQKWALLINYLLISIIIILRFVVN